MRRAIAAALAACLAGAPALAKTPTAPNPNAGGGPQCALTGSPNVFIEGKAMLRLGDVAGCPGVRYEVLPGIFINGQPAVRLLPKDDCAPGGSPSVSVDGKSAQTQGAGC